jgi:acetyltransferase-like isoleucine patch superfamily enzyme
MSLSSEQRAHLRTFLLSLRHQVHARLTLVNLVSGPLPHFASSIVRTPLYRAIGLSIGSGAAIMGNLELISGVPGLYDKLVIGSDAVIAHHVTINLDATVRIGRNVVISPHVLIYTGSHQIGAGNRRAREVVAEPVSIEDGAWIAVGAIILPGVTIGRGSIVAPGAVVFQDVPPNSYVKGNPARVVNRLPERSIDMSRWSASE